MSRRLCLNIVTKTDIYSERVENPFLSLPARLRGGFKKHFYCLNLDLLDLRINLIGEKKARNTAFAELMRDRVGEGSLKVDIVLKKARAQLDEAYYAIAERVNAFVVIEGVGDYEPFIKKLNINIAKFNLLVVQASRRAGKRGGGKNSTTGGSHEER